MLTNNTPLDLPMYQQVIDAIAPLNLPISGSELHGILCGYLSANAASKGETYLRALTNHATDTVRRAVAPILFEVYAISQQQVSQSGFDFQLLLPDDSAPLLARAQAFSEWCDGFTQGIRMAGIDYDTLQSDDAQDAIEHLSEFSEMDYDTIDCSEQDERALMEICEYARMAVLHIYSDVISNHPLDEQDSESTH
jgi:uncharacterized protein